MGRPVQCVIADSCIGGVYEASLCAKKFEANNVGVSLSVTPCWCYGSETMDMNPSYPKQSGDLMELNVPVQYILPQHWLHIIRWVFLHLVFMAGMCRI